VSVPKAPHKIRRRRGHFLLDLPKALLGFAALLALLGGLPAVLLIATQRYGPAGVSLLTSPTQLLTSPDTGAAFLLALIIVGWLGWASFALSVVLEVPAQLRGRAVPRLPGLTWSQPVASALVGAVLLLGPTAGAALAANTSTTVPQRSAVTATAPLTAYTTNAPTTGSTTADSSTSPTYTVEQTRPAQSLWSIAAAQLGDGDRWQEIADLNQGRTMVDGRIFEATGPIQPGWVLLMPSTSSTTTGAATPTKAAAPAPQAERAVTVHTGDSLSGIAQKQLGDADRYPELFAANQDRAEPGGAHLTDPDVIDPGWTLVIPGTTTTPAPAPVGTPGTGGEGSTPTTGGPGTGGGHTPAPGTSTSTAPAPVTSTPAQGGTTPTTAPTTAPAPVATTPAAQAPTTHAPAAGSTTAPTHAAEASPAEDQGEDSSALYTAAIATSLSAAALLGTIALRRKVQQRRRRPRRRIPLPEPASASAQLEQQMRTVADGPSLELLDIALRTMAVNCRATGQQLPPVEAIRVTNRGVELYLAAATPPVAPFREDQDNPDLWWCPAKGATLLAPDDAHDITAPYPALVSLGQTADRDPVLVNLEAIGLLRLAGSDEDVHAIMLGLAVELASSELVDDTAVLLAELGEELAGVYPIRVEYQPTLADAAQDLLAHDAFQRSALETGGFTGLDEARLSDDGGDTWVPKILICPAAPEAKEAAALSDLLTSRPRTAGGYITKAGPELDLFGGWTLSAAPGGTVDLPGLDLAVTLQRLEADAYLPLIHLLATSNRTDDVAAPEWTHSGRQPIPNGPAPLPDPRAPRTDAAQEPTAVTTVRMEKSTGTSATSIPGFSALAPSVNADAPDHQEEEGGLAAEAVGLAPDAPAHQAVPGPGRQDEDEDEDAWASQDAPVPDGEQADEQADDPAEQDADLFDQTLSQVLREAQDAGGHDQEPAPQDHQAGSGPELLDVDEDQDADSALAPAALAGAHPQPVIRPVAQVAPAATNVLAALRTRPPAPDGPQVQLLGTVDLLNCRGEVESNRRNTLLEIAAWLILNPGKTRHELDFDLWNGQRILAKGRNAHMSRLRGWLGRDPMLPANHPQSPYLPPVTNGIYVFGPKVTSDWSQFQDLYRQGMDSSGAQADLALAHALALVRAHPFLGVEKYKYVWIGHHVEEMISAIIDVADELARRRLALRDFRGAAAAASAGLTVDQQSDRLLGSLLTVHSESGDREQLNRTIHQIHKAQQELGTDTSPVLKSLIATLEDAERRIVSA